MKIRTFTVVLLLAAFANIQAGAQTSGNNSPYSRYGIGTLSDEAQGFNKGMAGVAQGMRGNAIINWQNPASYAAFDSLTMLFDIGASFSTASMSYNGSTVKPQNTTLDYVQAGFRLFKNIGISFGLRPYSVIGYNFASTKTMEDIDGYGEKINKAEYLGEGGTHLVYGGVGWAPFPAFSIGANAGYLWGDYSHSSAVSFSETTIQSLSRYYKGTINTWLLDAGVQFTCKLGKMDNLTLGATVGIGHNINESAQFINQKLLSSSVIGADTTRIGNAYEMPWTISAGAAWTHNGRLTVGVDYSIQQWKKCRFPELVNEGNTQVYRVGTNSFSNSHKIAVGGEYLNNPEGLRFRDHIRYRFGFSYSTPYYKVNGQDGPKDYKASIGVGIPIINQYSNRSVVNVSAQYERIDAAKSTMIKENYFRLCVGLTFNAKWFNKWKFE